VNTQTNTMSPQVEAAIQQARADVVEAVIPDFARRFPEQFEQAVETVACYRLRERGCTGGEPVPA